MKPKTMILLVVAVGCGLVASYMTSRVIADRSTPTEQPKVSVVYAIKNVQQYQTIRNPEEYFQVREVSQDSAPRGRYVTDLEQLRGKCLVNPVGVDKHVNVEEILSAENMHMTARIPEGMRAVTVKASQDISVGGFVAPGMHVDIICVPNGRIEAKTILQRVHVLAVNHMDRRDPEKPHIETHYVTFAVSPADAEKLTLAQHSGTLRLSLRNHQDTKVAITSGAKADDLSRSSLDSSDPTGQDETAPTTAPVSVPRLPTGEAVAKDQTPKVETPQQPQVEWVMRIQNGPRIEQHKFYKELPDKVEKSNPETGPDAPAPADPAEPTPTKDAPAKDPSGKK